MYRNNSIWDDLKYQYQNGGVTTRLIFINVIAYIAVYLIRLPVQRGLQLENIQMSCWPIQLKYLQHD